MKTLMISLFLSTAVLVHPKTGTEIRATYYNPSHSQCHGNPLITADGSKINLKQLKDGKIRWIALSRDLLKEGYRLGDTIEVECSNPFFQGLWVIKDKMGKSKKQTVDFLLHPSCSQKPPRTVIIRKYERNIHR